MDHEAKGGYIVNDPLFKACTEPAMRGGIPIQAMFGAILVVVILVAIAMLITLGDWRSLLWGFIYLPIHAMLGLWSKDEPRFAELFMLKLRSKGRCINTRAWGGSSYSPLGPVRKIKK